MNQTKGGKHTFWPQPSTQPLENGETRKIDARTHKFTFMYNTRTLCKYVSQGGKHKFHPLPYTNPLKNGETRNIYAIPKPNPVEQPLVNFSKVSLLPSCLYKMPHKTKF